MRVVEHVVDGAGRAGTAVGGRKAVVLFAQRLVVNRRQVGSVIRKGRGVGVGVVGHGT